MATTEHPQLATADDLAWDLFLEALDPQSQAALRVPPGAAIVADDAPDRDELVRRYHSERRPVVVVRADGTSQVKRPSSFPRALLLFGAALGVWIAWRSAQREPVS
jgi:hypothetical protein